jgi:hypothetical protein
MGAAWVVVILSHSRQFIFYRTKKTASSTLGQALALHCRTGDWISIVYLTPEQKKQFAGSTMADHWEKQPGSVGAPYSIAPLGKKTLSEYAEVLDWVHGGPRDLHNMTRARHPLRRTVPLPGYPTVVGVRNPWAWVFSIHQHGKRDSHNLNVENILSADRNPVVEGCTYHIRFEHLKEDVDRVGEALGLDLRLGRINDRDSSMDYVSFFTKHTRDLVAKRFAPMIERFGYEFGK